MSWSVARRWAWLAVAGACVAAGLWLALPRADRAARRVEPSVLIEPPDDGTARVYAFRPGAERRLTFRLALERESFPVDVDLLAEDWRPVYREEGLEAEALDAGARLTLRCPAAACPPGRYTLRVAPLRPTEPAVTVSFEIVDR